MTTRPSSAFAIGYHHYLVPASPAVRDLPLAQRRGTVSASTCSPLPHSAFLAADSATMPPVGVISPVNVGVVVKATSHSSQRQDGRPYPTLRLDKLSHSANVTVLSEEPPVFMVNEFLSSAQCEALIDSARAGSLTPVDYEQCVSIDPSRLQLLTPLLVAAAAPPVSHAVDAGAGLVEAAQTGLLALLGATAVAGGLTALVRYFLEVASPGFRGKKMDALTARGDAGEAVESVLSQLELMSCQSRDTFDATRVTRYDKGDQQRRHYDARAPVGGGNSMADASLGIDSHSGPGQRLLQCLVYLNDLPNGGGGATKFFHPSLNGLEVMPNKGSCLLFFPAFSDGTMDPRMEHSGEPVRQGIIRALKLGKTKVRRYVVLAQEDVGHAKYVTPLSSILVVHALGVACRSNPVIVAKPSSRH